MDFFLLLSLFLGCIILSAFFIACETAFSAMSKTHMKSLAEENNKRAVRVMKLSENTERRHLTVHIGKLFSCSFMALFAMGLCHHIPNGSKAIVWLSFVGVLILVSFFEVAVKTIVTKHSDRFVLVFVSVLQGFQWLFFPLSILLSFWKKLLSSLSKKEEENKMSQEELLLLVEEVEQEGSIDKDEGSLLKNVIEFTDLKAEEILTHRVNVEGFSSETTKEEIAKMFSETKFSRLIMYDGDLDHIKGVLHQKDFYTETGITDQDVTELITEPLFIPQNTKISDLLKQLQTNQSHMAVVVDEYGETLGIVTMEDILEELVGEIWDEHDEVIEVFEQIDDTTSRMGGDVDLNDFCEQFGITVESESSTLNGWIAEKLEKIAEEGDSFVHENLSIKVLETESHRASCVEVVILPPPEEEESDGEKTESEA